MKRNMEKEIEVRFEPSCMINPIEFIWEDKPDAEGILRIKGYKSLGWRPYE